MLTGMMASNLVGLHTAVPFCSLVGFRGRFPPNTGTAVAAAVAGPVAAAVAGPVASTVAAAAVATTVEPSTDTRREKIATTKIIYQFFFGLVSGVTCLLSSEQAGVDLRRSRP